MNEQEHTINKPLTGLFEYVILVSQLEKIEHEIGRRVHAAQVDEDHVRIFLTWKEAKWYTDMWENVHG